MNAKSRGLAALALLCLALPRAEAFTITFNPATTTNYLDVTIAVPGHIEVPQFGQPRWIPDEPLTTAIFMGWGIGASLGYGEFGDGNLGVRWLGGNGWGYQYSAFVGATGPNTPVFFIGSQGPLFPVGWVGPIPAVIINKDAAIPEARITWDLTSVSVPDAHSTIWAFAAALGGLAVHRRSLLIRR
jgi:hypothetical protein